MDEQRQMLFVNQFLPSSEQKLIDRLRESATRRVTRPPDVTEALRGVPLDSINDVVVGPSHVGVLFADGQIGRFAYVATSRALAPSVSPAKSTSAPSTAPAASDASGGASGGRGGSRSQPNAAGAAAAPDLPGPPPGLISRSAKFRRYDSSVSGRVMLAASGGRRGHSGSVIIDRARPMLPASSVPEDLIAQAQVVLQGKSREVIIRELQRTNLNVNEAVNNLLSRDDDDDEGSEGADMLIPEELLSMLDSHPGGAGGADYDQDSFEYLMSGRDKAREKAAKEKEKKSKPVIECNSDTEALRRYEIPLGSTNEPWEGIDNKQTAVAGPRRFTHIACTQSELLAISTDNKLYGWKWTEAAGDVSPHVMYEKLKLADGEVLTHIAACSLRVAVMTSAGRLASWLDTVACGERLSEALFVPPQKVGAAEQVEQVVVSNHLAVARFPNNVFFWCGLYPVNDRRRIFEKARSRQRKHVTFDTTQIVEGSEVRTKSGPIYSIGCIATNLAGPTPMIGILMENAWSLSEVCRFRLLDPATYDADRFDPAAAAAAAAMSDAESREAAVAQQALSSGNRKRPATDEVFSAEPKQREEPWPISDVIFIHEEVQNDTAIVKIVDGGYCAVEYQPAAASPTDAFATTASKALASKGDKEKPQQKFRLIRKDELTVVSHKMRYARSPNSMRIEPYRFVLSGSTATKRVISAVADSLGIRALVERRGSAAIVRISVCGRTLTSHSLPVHAPSLHSPSGDKRPPTLINYGDDSILLLRDAHGGIIPLVRDAAAGFREPSYLQLPASSITALTVKSFKNKDRLPSWAPKANREAVIVSLQGTHPTTLQRRLPSLLYTVMCCDQAAVMQLLDALQKEEDFELSQREIVEARADGGRNVLHAAVMNAFATKNSLEADVENPLDVLTTSETRSTAEQVRAALDKKWNEMLRTRSSNRAAGASGEAAGSSSAIVMPAFPTPFPEPIPLPPAPELSSPIKTREERRRSKEAKEAAAASASAAGASFSAESVSVVRTPEDAAVAQAIIKREIDEGSPMPQLVTPQPVENPKTRQENAMAIVKMLVTHPICMPFLADLLGCRDILGQTPFMAAVNHRAYSAARFIFKAIKSLFVEGEDGKFDASMADQLLPFIFPAGSRPDDSPLFILCYNDTCSFTWTGDEHINQDIFECRTCGLTGSLCCCTECALTCHRNHDCKLKRTSPTAYCDCWEKACCKALVSGNQHARESLLMSLIGKSNLYTMLNGRGEHILLCLARKLARQSSEQWNYTRRPRRIQAPGAKDGQVPEHDLDPPKFARTALLYCLRNWTVIKSLAMIGVRQMDQSMPMAEEIFHLNAQHGSSHLDKFMLILLTKCSDETNIALESLLRILTETHNRAMQSGASGELEEVNFVISRFVRSVARLFILAVVISSVAASTAVSGLAPSRDSSSISPSSILERHAPFRGISFSGIFGHLRKDTAKDSKLKNMGMFIVRCKIFFEHFAVFTLHEMAQLADASLAPVRTGILRPCVSLAALFGSTADSLENLEKYINSEPDITQTSMGGRREETEERGGGEQREEKKRKRRGDMSAARYGRWFGGGDAPSSSSRRDTDRDEPPSESQGEAGGAGTGERGSEREKYRNPGETSEDDSDGSDSDGDAPSSRRITSQSDALAAANEEEAAAIEQATRNSHDIEDIDSSSDDEEVESDSEADHREEDEEEEEDEEMEERVEGGEDEDVDMEYVTSEATSRDEQPTSRREGDEGDETNQGGAQGQQERRSTGGRAPRRGRWVDDTWVPEQRREGDEERSRSNSGQPADAYDFLDHGSSEEHDPSSPEYSSLSEGDERQRGGRRDGRRRRRKAAAEAAEAAEALEEAAAIAGHPAPIRSDAIPVDRVIGLRIEPSEREREMERQEREERDRESDEEMMERVERVAVSDALDALEESERGGGEEQGREGGEEGTSARTRPAAGTSSRGDAAAAAEDDDDEDITEPTEAQMAEALRQRDARLRANPARRGAPRAGYMARRGGLTSSSGSGRGGESRGGGEEEPTSSDRLTSRRNATPDASTYVRAVIRGGATGGVPSRAARAAFHRRPPLPPWISRGTTSRDDSIEGSRLATRATGGTTRGTTGGGGSGSSSDEKTKAPETTQELKEDEAPTAGKAAIQLAVAFSFAVRVIGDLLPVVAAGGSNTAAYARASCSPSRVSAYRDMEQLNELDEPVRRRAINHVVTRLDDSWRWLAVVLDHAEAQIKYINAWTSTEESRKKESKESKKKGSSQRKKSPHASPTAPAEPISSSRSAAAPLSPLAHSKARKETMACLLGVLRGHSGEAGDDTPLVDLDTLRAPALVVDAYLGFVESKAEAEKMFEQSKKKKRKPSLLSLSRMHPSSSPQNKSGGEEEKEEIVGVRRFYQRSNSVSFPGASFTDAHDTLQQSCLQSLPIVERPQLLTSTVEKEVIFGPPASTQERTREEHDKVIRSHGVSHPHNQSLTAAPISSHRLFVLGQEEEGEKEKEKEESEERDVKDVAMSATASPSVEEIVDSPGTAAKKKPAPKGRGRGRKRARTGEVKQNDDDDVIVIDDDEEPKAAVAEGKTTMQIYREGRLRQALQKGRKSPPTGFEQVTYEEILETFKIFREHPLRKLMGRWRFALQLIAKELHTELTEALGGDLSGSRLLRELAGFEMKQHELRARMEKYRATATKDVSIEVHRDPASLVRETCYQLNRTFTRRMAMRGTEKMSGSSGVLRGGGEKRDEPLPVLASHKVKVKFTDEPGEGTGVARSYYTALAEALASLRQLPFTDYGYTPDNDEYLYGGAAPAGAPAASPSSSSGRRIQLIRGRDTFYATVTSSAAGGGGATRRRVSSFDRRIPLNYLHPPYTPADMLTAEALDVSPELLVDLREETYTRREGADKLPTELTDRLFILIRAIYPTAAARLTGMFMDLPLSHIILVLGDPAALKLYLGDAIDQMMATAAPSDIALLRGEDEKKELISAPITSTEADDAPLFFRPSKKAHYSPVPGRLSPARMNAFRNVGRVLGLCLMQCEMFPLRLSRHVLKYILGRPLNWHDFAFYDPQMFESLRKLIVEGCSTTDHRQFFDDLQMTFSIDMPPEATGMPSSTLDLIPGGSDVLVTKDNIIEYVYRFVEARLLGTTNGRCLAAIRQGVQDVIPQAMLDNLTAEDLRLVLCGTETVSLSLMQSYTAWTDESHAAPEAIEKFKQWFWQVADRLSAQEKQDLIFFWTGAPSLPSTEEGFQPLPTIVIRPTDDGFLPTANTCISRLYLPLYNSKKTLTAKLQLAIKAKNFGFV